MKTETAKIRAILAAAKKRGDAWRMADRTWTVLLPADSRGLQQTCQNLEPWQAADLLTTPWLTPDELQAEAER